MFYFTAQNPVNQLYVMTRERILRPETIYDINQELLRCGYNPSYLTYIDQTRDIPDEFVFDYEYFQITSTTVTSSSSTVSTTTSRSLSSGPIGPESPSIAICTSPPDLGPGPVVPSCSGPRDLGVGPVVPSCPLSPGGPLNLPSPITGLPTICSSTWQVRTLETSHVRIHKYYTCVFIYYIDINEYIV